MLVPSLNQNWRLSLERICPQGSRTPFSNTFILYEAWFPGSFRDDLRRDMKLGMEAWCDIPMNPPAPEYSCKLTEQNIRGKEEGIRCKLGTDISFLGPELGNSYFPLLCSFVFSQPFQKQSWLGKPWYYNTSSWHRTYRVSQKNASKICVWIMAVAYSRCLGSTWTKKQTPSRIH